MSRHERPKKFSTGKMPRPRAGRRHRFAEEGSSLLRIRILEGATEAFGRLGFADTRVEDILKASDVSRPSFYKFFRNKEEVFNALAESMSFSLVQMVRGAVTQTSGPVEKIERGIEMYLQWRISTGAFGRVLEAEARNPGTFAATQREAILESVMSIFQIEVAAAQQVGIDPLTYVGLTATLEAIGNSLIVSADPSDEEIARRKNVMMRIVLGALSPRNPWDKVLAGRGKKPGGS